MKLKRKGLGNFVVALVAFIAPVAFGACRAIFYEEEVPNGFDSFVKTIKEEKR